MQLVTALQFKRLNIERAKDGRFIRKRNVELVGVVKDLTAPIEPIGPRVLRFTISTGAVDRDLDTISPQGWHLDHFRRNPVVLWAHRAEDLPIGKVVALDTAPDRLLSSVEFLPEGYGQASLFADQVYRLAADGWLAATSVGFRPIKWDFTDDKERGAEDWFPGVDYHEQELVELSLCTVPANPEALIEPVLAPVAAAASLGRRRRFLEYHEAIHASADTGCR